MTSAAKQNEPVSAATLRRVESKIVAKPTEELKAALEGRDPNTIGYKLITQVLKDREAANVDLTEQQ